MSTAALVEGVFTRSPVPQVIFSALGQPLAANQAYVERFGELPRDYNVLNDEVAEAVGGIDAVRRSLDGRTVETQTVWHDRKSDVQPGPASANRVALSCTLVPLFDGERRVSQVAVVFKDVPPELTARELAEAERDRLAEALAEKDRLAEALRRSEERLRATLEAAEVGTWEWDLSEDRVVWSSNIEGIFRLPPGAFAGTYDAWLALVHPDDRSAAAKRVADALATNGPYEGELRVLRPDGTSGWQATRGYVVVGDDGHARALRGIVVDITERRAAEDLLRMQARVLEHMTEGVIVSDKAGTVVYTNAAADRMFGYGRGQLIGEQGSRLNGLPAGEYEARVTEVASELERCGEWYGEWLSRRHDGSLFTTRSRVTALELEGRPHYLTVQEDVTAENDARRREEVLADALRLSETRYRTFVEQSTEGIWRCELDAAVPIDAPVDAQVDAIYEHGFLAECNDAMARIYGHDSAASLVGARVADLLPREENARYLRDFVLGGYRIEGGESIQRDRHVFQSSLVGVVDAGRLVRAWGTQRDVTPQVQAREAAEAANRAKDDFLAMLGHELRNPLSPILTALELMELDEQGVYGKERAIIERQVRYVVRLVDDMLDVARIVRGKVSLDLRPIELAECLASALELSGPFIKQRAHAVTVDVPDGLMVIGDPTRLGQVFTNLVMNAAKYTPPGGRIAITGGVVDTRAHVTVTDSGVGIRPEILRRVFEPFVQERQALDRSEGGLGLGLAIVRSLVELHGGTVEARSQGPGRGSEFEVWLPLVREADVGRSRVRSAVRAKRRERRRVLVVDDNTDAAESLAAALSHLGHDVRIAYDAMSALALFESFSPQICLLDIGLPGMDGFELARRIRALAGFEEVPLIAVTGYGQEHHRYAAQVAGFNDLLVKPVGIAALDALVSAASDIS